MTVLTGEQIIAHDIVIPYIHHKQDDGKLPSYGPDGCLYTLRVDVVWEHCLLPSMASIDLKTLEQVYMPLDCCGILTLKSTYNRKGLILVTNSPVDPGYNGPLTVRLFNSSSFTQVLYGEGGFMQLMIHRLEKGTDLAYNGRWQNGGK